MAQLYSIPFTRLLRSLLLQCVFLLGIVSTVVAQGEEPIPPSIATLPINHDGPWSNFNGPGWTQDGTIIDGQDLEGGNGSSAQFRSNEAYIDIRFQNQSNTGFKLSYSLQAVTTRAYDASFTVSYSTDGGKTYTATESANGIKPERTMERLTDLLPATATNIRFTLNSASQAYILLDAIELVQTPEVLEYTPVSGVPGTAVTINGNRLNGATVKFGEIDVPATLKVKDSKGVEAEVNGVTVNEEGTEITAYVPYGATTAPIIINTQYGASTTELFTVPAPAFRVGDPFTPTSGIAGTTVVLNGNNFIDAREVLFNGHKATFTVDHNGQITATVPAMASTGPITVTTPVGSVSSSDFNVPKPVIMAFTPTEGKALVTEVIISGKYFNGVTDIKFNGVAAQGFEINEANEEIIVKVPLGASTGPITVTSPAGSTTSEDPFSVPAPKFVARQVTVGDGTADLEFNPARTGAGKQITIYGENLASVSRVVFLGAGGEGVDGTNLVATTDTEMTVTVPVGAESGLLQLIAAGDKTATSSQEFTFVPAPVVTEVNPIYGERETAITITGSNFQEATSVKIGNGEITAPNFTVNTEGTIITLSIPNDATTGKVAVTTLHGGTGVWSGTFDVILAPTITAFTPAEGPIGQEITLTGTNLKYVTEVVFLGDDNTEGESDAKVTLTTPNDSDTELVFQVPTGTPAGKGKLLVRNSVDDATSVAEFEVILHPVVQSLTPTMGVVTSTVTIAGYNFNNATSLNFGGVVIPVATEGTEGFKVESDKQITVTVPADAPVSSPIVITSPSGNSEAVNFTVIKTPTIESFVKERGIVGDEVIITGTNFYGDDNNAITVTFAGTEGRVNAQITNVTPTQITVRVPEGAVTGSLIVTNAAGPSDPSTDYVVATTPEIFSFTPISGKVGDDVTITGWLMQNVTHVAFNGIPASVTPSTDGRTIKVKVPVGATTGRLALLVGENESPVFTTAEDEIFTVIPAPTIATVSPEKGVGGTVVTITGTNFIKVTSVTFNGVAVAAADMAVNETFDVLTVTVPATAKTGDIVVTADAGESIYRNFIVPTPANITFTPSISYAHQLVTIRGQYFTNATEINFNGKKITAGIAVVNEVEGSLDPERFQLITVKAPFDAGTGKITVTTPAGSGVSADDYTVIEPKIMTISATEGYVGKTEVTITGEFFTQYWDETLNDGVGGIATKAPIVRFEGTDPVTAETYKVDGTEIKIIVPGGRVNGSIRVESGSGISEPMPFSVLAPVLSSVSPAAVYAGQTVVISGTNFINVTNMSYGGVSIPAEDYDLVLEAGKEEEGTGTITFKAPAVLHNSSNILSVTSTSGTGISTALTVYKPIITNVFETGKESPVDRSVYAGVNTVTIKGTRFDEYWDKAVMRATPTLSLVRTGTNGAVTPITDFILTPSATEEGVDEIVASIPTTIPAGNYLVRVTSRSGAGQSTGTVGTITVLGTPTISNLSKTVGLIGDEFTINGTFFDDATKVTFLGINGEVDASFVRTSNTQLTVTVPTGATIGKIAVTTPFNGGAGTTVISDDIFRVVKAPIVYDFNAKSGPAGSTVTITGENLIAVDGKIKVSFKGHGGETIPALLADQVNLNATVVTEDLTTARQITLTVPENAITGVITLANEAGTTTTAEATATAVDVYTVTSPVVISFVNANGKRNNTDNPARLLETVKVKGYNLVGVQRLQIGSTSVFGYYEEDEHTLEMIVPRGAATDNFVTVRTGAGEDRSQDKLVIIRPTIEVAPNNLSFKITEGSTFDTKQYTVTARNLAVGENLVLSMTGETTFNISTNPESTEEGAWNRAMALSPDQNGNLVAAIYVRNTSTEVGKFLTGSIENRSVVGNVTTIVNLSSEIVPLPVELIAFNAVKQKNAVQLTWVTASEKDNDYFEVEMAEEKGAEFKAVGRVHSKVNTTSIRQDYQFSHKGHFTGTRYYRLKQVDLDGAFEYSKVVAVASSGLEVVAGAKVYPNPITAASKLVYNALEAGKLNVKVVNMNGTSVLNQAYDIEAGENTITLNLSESLPTGIYILIAEFNGQTEQVKLLKQ